MLCVDVEKRATVSGIKDHPWFTQCKWKETPGMLQCLRISLCSLFSEPIGHRAFKQSMKIDGTELRDASSRHQEDADTFLVTTQYAASQYVLQAYHFVSRACADKLRGSSPQNALHKLVRRTTRFCVSVTVPEAVKAVHKACSELGYASRQVSAHQVVSIPFICCTMVYSLCSRFSVAGVRVFT